MRRLYGEKRCRRLVVGAPAQLGVGRHADALGAQGVGLREAGHDGELVAIAGHAGSEPTENFPGQTEGEIESPRRPWRLGHLLHQSPQRSFPIDGPPGELAERIDAFDANAVATRVGAADPDMAPGIASGAEVDTEHPPRAHRNRAHATCQVSRVKTGSE